MKYRIIGTTIPAVEIKFDAPGETMYTQSGGMSWMSEGISMSTNTRGGFMKGLGRMFAGESMFMATYRAADCLTIRKFSLMYGIFIFDFFNTIFIFVFHMNYMRSSPCYITLPSNFVTNSSVENMLNNRLKL